MQDQYGAERELAMSLKQPVVSVLGEFESASSPNLVNSHADSEFTLSAPSRAYAASGAKADGRVVVGGVLSRHAGARPRLIAVVVTTRCT